ncbi:MAG: ParB/RepB/Spo0J family partition protein [Alphaproteobacteria bacterium]
MTTGNNRVRFATLDSALLARKGEATPATAVSQWIERSGGAETEEIERSVPEELAVLGRPRAGHGFVEVALDRLKPGAFQPRRRIDLDGLGALAESIKAYGVLQPILVRDDPDDAESYRIIAGERRWRAAALAGRRTVPVIVRKAEDDKAFEIALIENLQREDLDPLDEAAGYRRLLDEFGRTQEELARLLGKSRSHVANSLRLLGLPDEVKALVHDGTVSAGHARALLGADDPLAMAERVATEGLTVRATESLAKQGSRARPAPRADDALTTLQARLGLATGLIVALRRERDGGVGIRLCSMAELEALVRRLEQVAAPANGLQAEATPASESL